MPEVHTRPSEEREKEKERAYSADKWGSPAMTFNGEEGKEQWSQAGGNRLSFKALCLGAPFTTLLGGGREDGKICRLKENVHRVAHSKGLSRRHQKRSPGSF